MPKEEMARPEFGVGKPRTVKWNLTSEILELKQPLMRQQWHIMTHHDTSLLSYFTRPHFTKDFLCVVNMISFCLGGFHKFLSLMVGDMLTLAIVTYLFFCSYLSCQIGEALVGWNTIPATYKLLSNLIPQTWNLSKGRMAWKRPCFGRFKLQNQRWVRMDIYIYSLFIPKWSLYIVKIYVYIYIYYRPFHLTCNVYIYI